MAKKVIIFGGGVAGMSAAHELIERGFDVEIYERQLKYVGGKARSVDVPGTNSDQHPDMFLPGEHGFRFFPGFYKHVIDTMRRIPQQISDGKYSKATCYDNLVETKTIKICRPGDLEHIVLPNEFLKSLADVKMLYGIYKNRKLLGLLPGEGMFFIKKLFSIMASCDDRRNEQYENISWWDFLEASGKSDAYQKLLVIGITRTLVAADATKASTKTDGSIILQLVFDMLDPTIRADRLFNKPTNDAWLTPWYNYLVSKGVKYHKGFWFRGFDVDDQKKSIRSARVAKLDEKDKEETTVTADYYILAIPADKAADLTGNLRFIDPGLAGLAGIQYHMEWMTGAQFYLNKEVNINAGHVNYPHTAWALTSIDQMKFWKDYDLSKRGNGNVKSILSVDVSNWTNPDNCQGKHVAENTFERQKIKKHVWRQLKESVNKDGAEILSDDMIEYFYLDESIITKQERIRLYGPGHTGDWDPKNYNHEGMVINTVNSWKDRPDAVTKIPNLFLAADYVKTNTDLATMEAANEAARRAVNGIIEASGSAAKKCKVWELKEPLIFAPLKWYDKQVYARNKESKVSVPGWLKILMIPWIVVGITYFIMKILIFRLLAIKPH